MNTSHRQENIFSSSSDKFPAGHSISTTFPRAFATTSRKNNFDLTGFEVSRDRQRERERERKRERETGSSGSGGGRECTWQSSGVLAKRTTVYRSADKGLGLTIHHDPRLSTCHFRFAWRARRINYRDPSTTTTGYFLTPESLSCRQFNVPLCASFLIQLFLFLKLISIRRCSSDLIIRRGNPFSRNTFVLYIYISRARYNAR